MVNLRQVVLPPTLVAGGEYYVTAEGLGPVRANPAGRFSLKDFFCTEAKTS
jgi:hypothetical protein